MVNSTFNSQQLSTASLVASFIFAWGANPSGRVDQENMANGNNLLGMTTVAAFFLLGMPLSSSMVTT
jgi:hypothetical protein